MNPLKQTYVNRALQHQEADEIVQGVYYETSGGKIKSCCVGCLAHTNENAHGALFEQTNIPIWLSNVADAIHEGLTNEKSKKWPARFIAAVPEQIFTKQWTVLDIDKKIKAPFLIMVLESVLENFDRDKFPDVKKAVDGSIALWKRDDIGSQKWEAAESAARSAAWAAEARSAARSWAAESAARAAEARSAKYKQFSDGLVEIMEGANIK